MVLEGNGGQAIDRDRRLICLECECSYRRAECKETEERRFNIGRVLVLNDPPAMAAACCCC